MSIKIRSLVGSALLVGTLSLPYASEAADRIYVKVRPPARVHEVVTVRPAGVGYVWIPGYHVWQTDKYVWTSGRWDQAPRRNARWVPARWAHDRSGWYFIEGHWR